MDELDKKIVENFRGLCVRKDLTGTMKKGTNIPTYVIEYLLGKYCATDDTKAIENGMKKIKTILSNNYVKPGDSERIKSKIRQLGRYLIIDKIHVVYQERTDTYLAKFSNLKIDSFKVDPDLVYNNEKLLTSGIWCLLELEYCNPHALDEEESAEEVNSNDIFSNFRVKVRPRVRREKKTYLSPFKISRLLPIQMSNFDLDNMIQLRQKFTKDEWIDVILRSTGYEPVNLTKREKLHFLLRYVPLIQKNYNLVELGARSTGKSHIYSELSPYSLLLSSGKTTSSSMFYNISSRQIGLVGHWDTIAFDEIGGLSKCDDVLYQTLKQYMAIGSFARGSVSCNAEASLVFEGNTFKSVEDMINGGTLFDPLPESLKNDTAFIDRFMAYLPGWEVQKLTTSSITKRYGLLTDCFSEYCHLLRNFDYTSKLDDFFKLNDQFNIRDEIAVRRTFSGLVKLVYPDGNIPKEDARDFLEYAIEVRRRVVEQLRRIDPVEFAKIDFGYFDNETNQEKIIYVQEEYEKKLMEENLKPGYVYTIGKSLNQKISIYRLENKQIEGTGKLESKNIQGIGSYKKENKLVYESINAAFNYFISNIKSFSKVSFDKYDYGLFINDLKSSGNCDELSVAEFVGLVSSFLNKPVMNNTVICGQVVISGSMMPITSSIKDYVYTAINAGAKNIILPVDAKHKYDKLSNSLKEKLNVYYYQNPLEAAKIALGIGD